ncbi:cytochrome P450, partial [Mycobacterium szulgai]
ELKPNDEWVLFGYDGVYQAFRDDRIFTSANYDKTIGLVMGHTILAMGGREHHDHRNLVAKAFRATALERWEPSVIGPVCDQLVDEIKDHGAADLVKAVTFEFPTRIIATLLGLPEEDLDLFRRLSLDLISIPTDIMAGLNAAAELHGYFLNQVEQRRRKLTDDIIGDLVGAEIEGEKLTDEAIIAFLRLLLPAGLETTYRSSGNLLYLLLTHPEQLAVVYHDRSLIPGAIEEGLRFETPLTMVMRTTTEDVEIGGKTIPADAQIDMCMGSANRDDSRWTDPNTFDIQRPRQAHIAFAGGIHMCLGMHLARLETRVMLNSLFDRVKDLAFVPDDGTGVESKIVGLTFRSPNKLPVTFVPTA